MTQQTVSQIWQSIVKKFAAGSVAAGQRPENHKSDRLQPGISCSFCRYPDKWMWENCLLIERREWSRRSQHTCANLHHTRLWGAMPGYGDRDLLLWSKKKEPWKMSDDPGSRMVRELRKTFRRLPSHLPNRRAEPMHLATQPRCTNSNTTMRICTEVSVFAETWETRATYCLTPAQQKYCNSWHFGILAFSTLPVMATRGWAAACWAHVNQLQLDTFLRLIWIAPPSRWR